MSHLDGILKRGARGLRLERSDLIELAGFRSPTDLHRLGATALANRISRHGQKATYVCNLQINPSNICEGTCRFCAYRAREDDAHAYVMSEGEILRRIEDLQPSEVHIVGGMNRIWDYSRNLKLVERIHNRYPAIYIKGFTAVEIDYFARQSNRNLQSILTELKEAGLSGMPGGGAEIFAPRMRREQCPDKLSPEGWLGVHRGAHGLGLTTNATMLFGMGESAEEIVDHLLMLRDLQDDTQGFGCFIPLAYQDPERPRGGDESVAVRDNLAMIALSRLALDNIPHIKAYWPMIGLETASMALSFGADDLDGTLGQERIAHAAGAQSPRALAREQMERTIRLGGFEPAERGGDFSHLNEVAL